MRLTRRGKAALLFLGFAFALGAGLTWQMPAAGMSLPACQYEDGRVAGGAVQDGGCSWDAAEQGNGAGVSFYVIPEQGSACYHYPSDATRNECVPLRALTNP